MHVPPRWRTLHYARAPCRFVTALAELEQELAADVESGAVDLQDRRFEAHIFVTRAPKKTPAAPAASTAALAGGAGAGEAGAGGGEEREGCTAAALSRLLLEPTVASSALAATTAAAALADAAHKGAVAAHAAAAAGAAPAAGASAEQPQPPPPPRPATRLQDLWGWNGRPEWEQVFAQVAEQAAARQSIGVAFCGTPVIGKSIKEMCKKHSSAASGVLFKLHKENF
jgi:hypothetical protein